MKRLLVLFFAVLPYFSFAACWESIYLDNEAKDNTFIDLCGITGKDIKIFWVKHTYQKQKELEGYLYKKYDSVKSLESVDCKNNKILSNEVYYYLGDDTTYSWRNNTKTYQNIIPDSVGENIKNTACNIEDFKERLNFSKPLLGENSCFSKEVYTTETKVISYDACQKRTYKNLVKAKTGTIIKIDEALKIFGYNTLIEDVLINCSTKNYTVISGQKYEVTDDDVKFLSDSSPEIEFVYDAGLSNFLYNVFCVAISKKPIYKNK